MKNLASVICVIVILAVLRIGLPTTNHVVLTPEITQSERLFMSSLFNTSVIGVRDVHDIVIFKTGKVHVLGSPTCHVVLLPFTSGWYVL